FSLAPYLKFMNSAVKSPIHEYFSTNPRLFARSIAIFKRNNIRCLSQCITDNGSALLTYNTIMRNHSSHRTSSITPSWYIHLQTLLCVSPTSLKLVSPISDPNLLPQSEFSPFPTLTHSNARRAQEWIAFRNNSDIAFGRTIQISPNRVANIAHWQLA